jgi:selenocysteine lyase/cysteine desulfurase
MKHALSQSRRKFIHQFSISSLAAFSFPALAGSQVALPAYADDEAYWEMVKKQFAVPAHLIMMNAANLCPSPYAIAVKGAEYSSNLNKDVSFQYRAVFAERRKQSIGLLAEFVGTDKEEIGITRNTSESNCIIVHGLDLKAGDEVIIWEQNHPSNEAVWLNRAKRIGFTVKKIAVPANPSSIQDLIAPFEKAISTKTKVIAFSHISNLSGIALPAKEICALAKSKDILTLVDGAQALGAAMLNLHDLGCSFYTASTHKWLMGPMENGILYVSKESINKVWPNIIGAGWKESKTVDENVCVLGQRNDPTTAVLSDTVEFHLSIGKKNIEDRVVRLSSYLKEQIKAKIPQAIFVTPMSSILSGGIVIVNLPGKDPREVYQKLYADYGIACAPSGGVRLSPHIYNTLKDLDKAVSALASLA